MNRTSHAQSALNLIETRGRNLTGGKKVAVAVANRIIENEHASTIV